MVLTGVEVAQASDSRCSPTGGLDCTIPKNSKVLTLKHDSQEAYERVDDQKRNDSNQQPLVEPGGRDSQKE